MDNFSNISSQPLVFIDTSNKVQSQTQDTYNGNIYNSQEIQQQVQYQETPYLRQKYQTHENLQAAQQVNSTKEKNSRPFSPTIVFSPLVKRDMSIQEWKDRCTTAATINYYVGALNCMVILWIYFVVFDKFAQFNPVMVLLFVQQFILSMFAWSCSSEVYEFYIRQHLWVYFALAFFNIVYFVMGNIGGYYLFAYTRGGLYQYTGMSIIFFICSSTSTIIMQIISAGFYIELKFYQKPLVLSNENKSENLHTNINLKQSSQNYQEPVKVLNLY
eukprot:403370527